MAQWNNDKKLFAFVKECLYTPVVGSILDGLGCYHRFLPQDIRPLRGDMKLVDRTTSVLMIDVYGPRKKPFGPPTEALDQLEEDRIYLAIDGTKRCTHRGELLTTAARTRKMTSTVVSGWYRDTPQMLEQNWPVFNCDCYTQDSSVRTQAVDFRCPVEFGDVWVNPGDIAFGDIDGVLITPQKYETEVPGEALRKATGEEVVRKAIEGGMIATTAFVKFGIL